MKTAHRSLYPMIIVEKETVTAAWKLYEYHLKIANTLFRIDYNFGSKPVTGESMPSRKKPLKELIMLIDFNTFPLSTVTDKHPTTGQTNVYYPMIEYSSHRHSTSLIAVVS